MRLQHFDSELRLRRAVRLALRGRGVRVRAVSPRHDARAGIVTHTQLVQVLSCTVQHTDATASATQGSGPGAQV